MPKKISKKKIQKASAKIRLPAPWEGGQDKLFYWSDENPDAQVLVAPCGTKVGKSFGASLWLAKEALLNPVFGVWVAPTYLKAKIGYRYIKAMVNIPEVCKCVDGLLEIRFKNGSFIKFLHGSDAEVTIEGEAVDRFVLDEAGKIQKQVWFSLLTTITQTKGLGIVTGTPRGYNWYYDIYRQAKSGDNFFIHTTLKTEDSPFIDKESVDKAKRLLTTSLFDQYYNAKFVSSSTVFGDLFHIWDEELQVPKGDIKFWIHPNAKFREGDIIHGVDIAKKRDYTVFYSVNLEGETVGFCRFKQSPYPQQAKRLETYLKKYFPAADNMIRYDETGVGTALGDILVEMDIDASITPVTFTNKSKNEMVTRLTLAIEQEWFSAPRIETIEHELSSYELSVTKTGLHSYSAPDGEHDDVVSACMLAVSAAYQHSMVEEAEKVLEQANSTPKSNSDILDYIHASNSEVDFFDNETDENFDFDFERE